MNQTNQLQDYINCNIDLKIGKQEKDCLFVAFNYITNEALHMT